ncbi:DUF429 domain-containing protein [Ochrobactrum sp. POC9]|uniref:DUF429 domain-containing protein n=1 Tax=unclassified Ochrobactrum TaxID=239106 RepID=UPI000D706BED|nr:DUF429 domain-containing protein [Ochrobactrum sp. POC9]MCH4540834.1 DUF429 domain-containing protein [Ochrobactrum sp. A-1]PWU71814.1 DUF429 domain-containing protein [Ochrobactrum sp. POC9]
MTQTATALAGVDGCPGGWIAVIGEGGSLRAEVFGSFSALAASLPDEAIIAVDMPIGLPEKGVRSAERAARAHLGERQSSLFSIPPRAAVYAEDYRESCSLSLERTDPPRKVSRQAFGLFPKICELDALLRGDAGLAARVIESHPELAFAALNGMKAMSLPKKIKSRINPAGMAERRALLQCYGLPEDFLKSPGPRGAKEDDFLDACAMYLVAGRHARGEACPQPDHVEHDAFGLRMAIWA